MKQFILTLSMVILFGVSLHSQEKDSVKSQFMFSVKPELFGLSGGSFGYKFSGDLVLFGGIDYFHLGTTVEENTTYLNLTGPNLPSPSSSKTEASFNAYNIYVAAKYFFIKQNAVKGYLLGEVSKPIVSGSFEEDGKADEDVKTLLDNLNLWGFKVAFGAEYFFADNFSFGGEFGLRMILLNTDLQENTPYQNYYYDPVTQQYITVTGTKRTETKMNFNFSFTYSTFTLNYYF